MTRTIKAEAELEAIIGTAPAPMMLKVIDHLDAGALRWIGAAPIALAAFGTVARGITATLAGGATGFAAADRREVRLPVALLDDATAIRVGDGAGLMFPLVGIREMLRVNGRVTQADDHEIRIAVEECYGHCGKALIRSDFWQAVPDATPPADIGSVVACSRFMGLGTMDAGGRADLSPKGDPAGAMVRLDGAGLWFADRPGNRRIDSFRNIITQPQVAALLLVPGSTHVARLSGRARISDDEAARAPFTVQGKMPALAVCIDDPAITLYDSPGLTRARLWPAGSPPDDIKPTALFAQHMKLNKNQGLGGMLTNAALSVPGVQGLLKKSLDKNYKDGLY
ncbi:pyridoxamine 5'-phosphate oxidase family protein [Tistrella sp. BH-R2-4]|uniref:Pyridoxamine 5'-phosphate oxidase family protein n=1 Tax=Tistrella arctica TaxID=3133430 RepID=A0ABU9YKU9_9PROT